MMLAYRSANTKQIFMVVLGMKHAATKIIPKLLNFEQKQYRINIAQDILTTYNEDQDLLNKVLTGPDDFFLFPKLKIPMKGKRK